MSQSKARLVTERASALQQRTEANMQVVRLLTYIINMQEDYPELPWPDLPDTYSEAVWRSAR